MSSMVKYRFDEIELEKLELWDEGNVRKSDVLVNIDDLVGSIKENGLCTPLLVNKKKSRYLVFSGQRRLKASRIAKLNIIPCFVFDDIDVKDAQVLSLSENLYREGLTMEDKSKAANELHKLFNNITKVAEALGVTDSTVRKYFRYNEMPERLKKYGKKPYTLTTTQVNDVYMKFGDTNKAVRALETLSNLETRDGRRKMHDAIKQSASSDSLENITKRAKELKRMKKYVIHLPDNIYQFIEKEAYRRGIEDEDLLVDIVETWIREENKG